MKKKDRQRLLSSSDWFSPWATTEDRINVYFPIREKIWKFLDANIMAVDPVPAPPPIEAQALIGFEISGSRWKKLYREWRNGR